MPENTDKTTPSIHPLDEYIGGKIQLVRLHQALSATALGKKTGISKTQISNYELGKTIIRMDTLYVIAQALNTPIEYFFEGYRPPQSPTPEALEIPELFELLGLFSTITGQRKRHNALQLLKIAANSKLPLSDYAQAISTAR